MTLEQLLALALLAFVGSFTPGPNNMIATVTGANHGFRAALPHVFGVPFGFASMLIAGALGVTALLLTYPFIAALLKWAGIAYLLFISWQLAPAGDRRGVQSSCHEAAFVLAVCCVSIRQSEAMDARCGGLFMTSNATLASIAIIVIVFSIAAMGSLLTWAWVGAALRNWLGVGSRLRVFRANPERNFQMAIAPGPPPKHFLKNCLGKGCARRGVSGVLRPQAKPWWEERVPPLSWDLACLRALPETPGAATISEIYFGICSNIAMGALLAATALWLATL